MAKIMGVILTTEPSPGMILQVLDICFFFCRVKTVTDEPSGNIDQQWDRIKEKEKTDQTWSLYRRHKGSH